jgi:hypothetical protein
MLHNPYSNWSLNFEFTHSANFRSYCFENVTQQDIMNSGRLQYSSTKFYLYKNNEMVANDYNYVMFEKYLKKYDVKKDMTYEQILKEFYLEKFKQYLNNK